MVYWSNWSGRNRVKPSALTFVRSEEDAQSTIREASSKGKKVRVAGAGHSHSLLVQNNDVILDTSGLSGLINIDTEKKSAWIWAGTPVFALGRVLHEAGFALKNQGDIDRQSIAGAASTGTHGTGKSLTNMSASVLGARLILSSGESLECSKIDEPAGFEVARLSLGAMGLITRLNVQLREAYKLIESGFEADYEDLENRIVPLTNDNDRFEFFWYPKTDLATVKITNETPDDPIYPLGPEGTRRAWNYEVLPNHRPHLHTEMEYSIPADQGPDCFAEIRHLLKNDFPEVSWPVEYRTVASDDIWLSMASARETVTISVHQDIREDERAYYEACEAIFNRYEGRPHWGKVNYQSGESLANLYPKWQDWWSVRNKFDPSDTFLNEYLSLLKRSI